MRRIQIEGEESEYLMDPEGNIYDMQGNFIGTANANELEEMEDETHIWKKTCLNTYKNIFRFLTYLSFIEYL